MIYPGDIQTAVTINESMKLAELAQDKVVLELGAYHGFSTVVLAQAAKMVHSVDWHMGDPMAGRGDTLGIHRENVKRYAQFMKVVTYAGRFEDVLPMFRLGAFDGCFLDGAHDADSVRRDLNMLTRLVKKGGWLAFHDYGRYAGPDKTGAFGVQEVVDEYAASKGVSVEVYDWLAVVWKPES